MSPYRRAFPVAARHTRAARRLTPQLACTALAALCGGLFASGWALGRSATVAAVQIPALPSVVPSAPAPAVDKLDPEEPEVPAGDEAWTQYTIEPAQARATIAVTARRAVAAITHRDPRALRAFVDPDEGITLASLDESARVVLSTDELSRCFEDPTPRLAGEELTTTCAALWRDHLSGPDFAHASHVDYNLPSAHGHPGSMVSAAGDDPAADATLQAHGDSIVVQYVARRPEHDVEECGDNSCGNVEGWSTLRLVFDPHGERWTLTAVLWADWAI